ncbi:MAG: hypothetical protein ACR2NF_00370 [Pirellulales bacterium]
MPRRHFHTVLNNLHATGVPLAVTQAVFNNNKPEPVYSCIPQANYSTGSYLFYKENLWNLAARMTDAKKLIFIDADIVFNDTSWFERTVELLDTYDIVQPFVNAVWLDETGAASAIKNCSAYAIKTEKVPNLTRYHPGFAWGMTREAFDAIGGWDDRMCTGNTDGAFAMCFRDTPGMHGLINWFIENQEPSVQSYQFKDYRRNILSHDFKVGYLKNSSVVHLWHGNPLDRQYISRKDLFKRSDDLTYPVEYRKDGLLVWQDEQSMNLGPKRYFEDKRDDG